MSAWDERFEANEGVRDALQIGETLSSAPASADPEVLSGLERARKVAAMLRAALEEVDAELVSADMLSKLSQFSAPALQNAVAFIGSPGPGTVNSLNVALDDLVDAVEPIRSVAPALSPEHQREAASAFRRAVGQHLSAIQQDRDALESAHADARTRLQEEITALETRVEEGRDAVADLDSTIGTQKGRLDAAIAEFQKQFSESEAARLKVANETITRIGSAVTESAASAIGELNDQAATTLAALEQAKAQAETLLDAVGAASVGGGYRKQATWQERMSWIWAAIAIASLAGVTAAGIWYLNTVGDDPFSLQDLWIRLVIVVPLAVIAGFAIAQSGRHQERERHAKRFELELAALGPYMALLPVEAQEKIRAEMVVKFFGQPETIVAGGDAIKANQVWDELVKVIGSLLPKR